MYDHVRMHISTSIYILWTADFILGFFLHMPQLVQTYVTYSICMYMCGMLMVCIYATDVYTYRCTYCTFHFWTADFISGFFFKIVRQPLVFLGTNTQLHSYV